MKSESKESDSSYSNLNIQRHFIGWQCRLREYSLRNNNGRPSLGICPRVLSENYVELNSSVILLLIPKNPIESIAQFRFIAKKTNDPNERYKKAVQLLSSIFFQHVGDFEGLMTGLFPKNEAPIAAPVRAFSDKGISIILFLLKILFKFFVVP